MIKFLKIIIVTVATCLIVYFAEKFIDSDIQLTVIKILAGFNLARAFTWIKNDEL